MSTDGGSTNEPLGKGTLMKTVYLTSPCAVDAIFGVGMMIYVWLLL